MSKISNEGLEQIRIIKNALDSMYDKLNKSVFVPKGKKAKNIDGDYNEVNTFNSVKDEFEAIAGIVALAEDWEEADAN
jgi:Mg2+/Co2+ transporter CorC